MKILERFPLTIPVLLAYVFAILTLPFMGLSLDATPLISAKATVLLGMFLVGGVTLIFSSIVFTGGLDLIRPSDPLGRYNESQSIAVVLGLSLVATWQLLVNQAFITPAVTPVLSSIPGTQTVLTFKLDAAIAEESLFGALAVLFYCMLQFFGSTFLISSSVVTPLVAEIFREFHIYVYGTVPQALLFVFGARMVLTGITFATLALSSDQRTASLAAPMILHIFLNVIS